MLELVKYFTQAVFSLEFWTNFPILILSVGATVGVSIYVYDQISDQVYAIKEKQQRRKNSFTLGIMLAK